MSPRVRTRHGEVTAELAWSGSGSRSEITPAVGRTVHLPPPPSIPYDFYLNDHNFFIDFFKLHHKNECFILFNLNIVSL
ncbi:hypothetical protein Hanom_Chr03g00212831 [Helianthus anomalus]